MRTNELCTIEDIMAAAKEYGWIELERFSPFFGKMVVDVITSDMPECEVCLD